MRYQTSQKRLHSEENKLLAVAAHNVCHCSGVGSVAAGAACN